MRYVSRSLCALLFSLSLSAATASEYESLPDETSSATADTRNEFSFSTDEEAAPASCVDESCCEGDVCNSCDCCGSCCGRGPLLGFIQPTDTCWANFISPMTNPVYFEDPRTLTEARLIFINHKLPSLLNGAVPASSLQILAL